MARDVLHFLVWSGRWAGGLVLSCAEGVNGAEILVKHLGGEKEQRAEGVVLCEGGNVALHGQVGEKGLDFRAAHLGRVANVVEVDVAFDPVGMGFFRADGVVFEANGVAHLGRAVSCQ
jgi:hypothetical protein